MGSRNSGTSIPEISGTACTRRQDLFQDWSMNRSKRSVCRSNRRRKSRSHVSLGVVGANGFEPSTSWSRTRHLNPINALFGVAYGTRSVISPLLVVPNLYLAFGVSFPSIGINDCGTTSESSWTQYVQGYDGNRMLGEIDQKIRSDFDRFLL